MASAQLRIGLVRRGYSSSGGAETYLKRLAQGVCAAGHQAHLFTGEEWPAEEWPSEALTRVPGAAPLQFADELEKLRPGAGCDVLMSLERVWQCDFFRAGDGVHRAWLQRRAQLAGPWRRVADQWNAKHRAILQLEESLLAQQRAGRVIANSHMVQAEITATYGYPADRIDLVHNGVPAAQFRAGEEQRAATRAQLGLSAEDLAVLFVGSGWERKGLRFAIDAVARAAIPQLRLLVAGKGSEARYRHGLVQFLGVARELPALLSAADIFLLPTIYDPFSNACLEAIAAGLPVITTRGNGFADIVEENIHGSIIDPPDNVEAIAAALRFWSDAERRQATRPQRVELGARFDISANVAQTLDVLLRNTGVPPVRPPDVSSGE
jgi:UDP-glucose:(heptosyl)LPS alpha-1,3-glucosyltransferase